MDFSLTKDQEMFRTQVKKAVEDIGGTQIARNVIQKKFDSFKKITNTLTELGSTMIPIPETHDGLDLSQLDMVPTFEELGRAVVPNLYLETMSFAVPILKQYGTRTQKALLNEIAIGEKRVSIAGLEPGGDFSEAGTQVALTKAGNEYVLNGTKIAVPYGLYAELFFVPVRHEKGVTLLSIPTEDVTLEQQQAIDETRQLAKVTFDNIAISEDQILGNIGSGWDVVETGLIYYNAALSSYLVGALESVVEMANEYAKIREQFNQPIGRFQSIKHRIVDMKVDLEIARSLSHYANWVVDTDETDKVAAVYSARSFASEAFLKAAGENIQVHGGIGFTEEMDCHLYLKQAQYYDQYLGNTTTHLDKIANVLETL